LTDQSQAAPLTSLRLQAFDALPAMVWVSDADRRCVYFNRAWLAFTGRALADELGDGWAYGVHPDDVARCVAVFADAFARQAPFRITYRLRRADGEHRWLLDLAQPTYDDDATFSGFVGVCTDITEQRRIEEELRRVLELSPDLICGAHSSDRYLHVNQAFSQLLGWTEAELLSQPLLDFVYPDDVPKTVQAMSHLGSGQQLIDFTNRLRCRDGQTRWIEWRAAPPSDDGIIYAVGRDITRRRRSSDLMAELEQVTQVGAWELDFATQQPRWIPQTFRIHGLDPATDPQPGLRQAVDFYAPEGRAQLEAALQRAMHTGEEWQVELPLITAQGRKIWVTAQGRVEVVDGVPVRAYGTFQDITERKRAEEARRALEARVAHAQKLELLGTFAGGIAHDFNKVLAAITSNLEVVLESFAPITSVVAMAQQARGFVDQLLTFSGQQEPEKGALRLQDALGDLMDVLLRSAGAARGGAVARRPPCLGAPVAALPDDDQPVRERGGRHRRAPRPHHLDAATRGGGGAAARPLGALPGGHPRAAVDPRRRPRDGRGDAERDLRAVLHDEGAAGDGLGVVCGAEHHAGARWCGARGERGGGRHHLPPVLRRRAFICAERADGWPDADARWAAGACGARSPGRGGPGPVGGDHAPPGRCGGRGAASCSPTTR
jgi:PAS domain S-box-containing protein